MIVLIVVALALPVNCTQGTSATCSDVATTTENSQGTCSVSGGSGSLNALDIVANGPSTVEISGGCDDSASDSFDITITGVTGEGSIQLETKNTNNNEGDGGVGSVTGTLDVSTFSTDCMGPEGCALTLAGNLTATIVGGAASGANLTISISLDHVDTWDTYPCGSDHTNALGCSGGGE
jgi:hypothetical protein